MDKKQRAAAIIFGVALFIALWFEFTYVMDHFFKYSDVAFGFISIAFIIQGCCGMAALAVGIDPSGSWFY